MERIILKNKPLVEAIFELRWGVEVSPNIVVPINIVGAGNIAFAAPSPDPHYKILIGEMYSKLKEEYPIYESLQSANMPDVISGYLVQHRFRQKANEWPLVQIGPGILTLNDVDNYVWEDFSERIKYLVNTFYDIYPNPEKVRINNLTLRYIDSIDFDYKNNVFAFIKENMKIDIDINSKLFENTKVNKLPLGFDLNFAYCCSNPKGIISLTLARAEKEGKEVLLWQTVVKSENIINDKNNIFNWVNQAHELASDWFFETIEGPLLEEFR